MSGDSIRNAFINIYPELCYNTKNTVDKIDFLKFINWVINENNVHLKRQVYNVIDSADINIKNSKKVFKDCLIIALGSKDISISDMTKNIKKYDKPQDWTYGYNEKDLIAISKETIIKSKKLYEDCIINNIPYFDTSNCRLQEYNKVFEYIEKNNI